MESLATRRQKYVSAFAVLAVGAAIVLTRQWVIGADTARLIGAWALVGFPLLTAAACWWCAGEMALAAMRVQWVLLGAAAFAFGAGEFLEGFMGLNVPGFTVAKLCYLVAIATFGAGLWMALRSFDGFLDLRKPTRISAVAIGVVSVIGAVGLADMFGRMGGDLTDKILLAVYPLGLLWLMAMPALALALTMSQMGGGLLARPWWAVLGGVVLLTCSNIILVVVSAVNIPITNTGPMEIGWWIGLSLIAIGAAMQIDVQKPSVPASSREEA